jgi:hypothetical protein
MDFHPRNDLMIDIMIIKDSNLIEQYINKKWFWNVWNMSIVGYLWWVFIKKYLVLKIWVFSKVHIAMKKYSFCIGFMHICIKEIIFRWG